MQGPVEILVLDPPNQWGARCMHMLGEERH